MRTQVTSTSKVSVQSWIAMIVFVGAPGELTIEFTVTFHCSGSSAIASKEEEGRTANCALLLFV
jgi:hypothetical protein